MIAKLAITVLSAFWLQVLPVEAAAASVAASSQDRPVAAAAPASAQAGPHVVILGAGLAGAAAARALVDAGIKNVLVLEARSRPGGRLHSVITHSGPVDLGAMWIHEANPDNPLMQLANTTLALPLSPLIQYNSGQVFGPEPDRQPANMMFYAGTYVSWVNQLQGRLNSLRAQEALSALPSRTSNSSTAPPSDVPFSQVYTEWLAANKATWQPQQIPLANAIMTINVQNLLNANVTKISTLRYGDAKMLPATDVHIKPGFDAIPKKLLPGIRVSYNTRVTNISQDPGSVFITLANGTSLTGDYVIVTAPLGVLKAGDITFDPPLPELKQAAIKQMGMGVLDKVVLVFKDQDVFWDKKADFVVMASSDWSGRWTAWLSYYRIFNMPVLVALNSADTALDLEAKTDKQVVDEALKVLTKAFKNVATPVETIVTRWANDPLARGSYSYFAVGNPLNITDTLAAPHGRVLFAGEATSKKMATALGALLSGRREAQRLINMTKAAAASPTATATRGAAGFKPAYVAAVTPVSGR